MTEKRPRIGILHYSAPPVIGGVEFIIRAHARRFARAGFPTRLIVGAGECTEPGVKTIVIPELLSRGGPLGRTLAALARGRVPAAFDREVRALEEALQRRFRSLDICMIHNVMTMHFNLVLTAALARLIPRNRRIRFVAWTHDLTFTDPRYHDHQRRRAPWSLLARPAPGCEYIAISRQRRDELHSVLGLPIEQIPVIPDGINVPGLLELPARVQGLFESGGLAGADLVALTPARILPRKNLAAGMEIIAALKAQGHTVRWIITGAPDPHNDASVALFGQLLDRRRRLGLESDVLLMTEQPGGRIGDREMRALYRLADLLLFPSEREGFGLPVLEAGLNGMLLCISDIPALRELAGDDAVYIRRGQRPSAIARRIWNAAQACPELRFRRHVIAQYDWERIFERFILPFITHANPQSPGKDRQPCPENGSDL